MTGWTIYETNAVKVHRLPDGTLYGSTGNTEDAIAFGEWIADTTKDKPKIADEFMAITVKPDGSTFLYSSKLFAIPCSAPQAIGCGADFALAAMDLGASPERAVEIACQRSAGCGGLITVVKGGAS